MFIQTLQIKDLKNAVRSKNNYFIDGIWKGKNTSFFLVVASLYYIRIILNKTISQLNSAINNLGSFIIDKHKFNKIYTSQTVVRPKSITTKALLRLETHE